MSLKFKLANKSVNTQFGPVAALLAYYQGQQLLEPLKNVVPDVKKSDFPLDSQLTQILLSMLTSCEYLSQVNTRLRPERKLAQVYRIDQFAHASTLSRSLDRLSLANLAELEQAIQVICLPGSRTRKHDWRGFLLLDFDLSGLLCGKQAQGSKKGYFSGKKMRLVGS